MRARALKSLVVHFNVRPRDIWEGHVTTRSEIQPGNNRSLGFPDIREGVTSRRLILRSVECLLVSIPPESQCWTTMHSSKASPKV